MNEREPGMDRTDADERIEPSFFYAGIAVFLVGFAAASYYTAFVQKAVSDPAIAAAPITQTWSVTLVATAAMNGYLAFLYRAFRKRASREKRAVMEREALIDYAPVGVFTYDRNGLIETVNTEMAAMLGAMPVDIAGKWDVYEFAHLRSPELKEFFHKALDGMPRETVIKTTDRNGQEAWYRFHAGPIMAADQTTVERVLVLVEDITRSKKMEAELATYAGDLETVVRQRTGQLFDAQKRLFAVVENTPVILWTTDAKGTVTLFLGKGAENIGLKPGEMVGRTVDEAFEGAPEVIEHHKRSMTGESVDATLVIGKRTFASHFGPLKNSKGKISGVIGVSLDVTDRG